MKIRILLLLSLGAILAALGACRSEPVEIKVVQTVEVVQTVQVEKVVEKEVTVVATVEVEKSVEVPAEAEEQEVVLGVVLPFTGSLGSFGTGFRNGIELAVEQMNAQLEAVGSKIHFSTVNADTEGTPEGAAKGVQTVVQTSGAEAIIGPLTTSEVLGAKQFADENGVIIFAPASSGVAGAIPDDNIFRIMYPPDTFAGQAFSQIARARGYENVVILYLDDPF